MDPVTGQVVATRIAGYLRHEEDLEHLVDWAERAMQEAEFSGSDPDTARDIVAHLGLADVKAFGLTWEDCEMFLGRLGYDVHVEVVEQ